MVTSNIVVTVVNVHIRTDPQGGWLSCEFIHWRYSEATAGTGNHTLPLPAPSPVNREGQIQHCQRDKAPTNTITSMLKVPERKCVP